MATNCILTTTVAIFPLLRTFRRIATLTLAELALEVMGKRGADHLMSIEVRNDHGPFLKVKCTFEIERLQQGDET
jgi:hypothetical protein